MPGSDPLGALLLCEICQDLELDLLVTPDARVRCLAGEIGFHEGEDDAFSETGAYILDDQREFQAPGEGLNMLDRDVGIGFMENEVNTNNLVTGLFQQNGGGEAVHAAAKPQQDAFFWHQTWDERVAVMTRGGQAFTQSSHPLHFSVSKVTRISGRWM